MAHEEIRAHLIGLQDFFAGLHYNPDKITFQNRIATLVNEGSCSQLYVLHEWESDEFLERVDDFADEWRHDPDLHWPPIPRHDSDALYEFNSVLKPLIRQLRPPNEPRSYNAHLQYTPHWYVDLCTQAISSLSTNTTVQPVIPAVPDVEKKPEVKVEHEAKKKPPNPRIPVRKEKPAKSNVVTKANGFYVEGEYWTVRFNGAIARYKDSRGLKYITYLIQHPDEHITAVSIVKQFNSVGQPRMRIDSAASHDLVDKDHPDSGYKIADDEALSNYNNRLRDNDDEMQEAKRYSDEATKERLTKERKEILSQIKHSKGIGGRIRKTGGGGEKARQSVKKAISRTIEAIKQDLPGLASHLQSNIPTGGTCKYISDPNIKFEIEN